MVNSMVVSKLRAVFLLILFLSGCAEKATDNPNEVYRLWSGRTPSSEVEIIRGKYWESGHRSKEYILFLEMKASKDWVQVFVKQNRLLPDTITIGIDSHPDWFTPSKDFQVFRGENDFNGSRYYFNLKEDHVFMYEMQF